MKKCRSFKNIRVAILTVSDSCSSGSRQDESGEILRVLLRARGALVIIKDIVPDREREIKNKLKFFCDRLNADFVLTTGGTGFGPRDVTPEATKCVIHKETVGLCEVMRMEGFKKTRQAALSRSVAGIRGKTLIVNLPGSPKAARESFAAIEDLVPHALAMMRGEGHCENSKIKIQKSKCIL